MKRKAFLLVFIFVWSVWVGVCSASPVLSRASGYVNDSARLLSSTAKQQLETFLTNVEKRSSAEIAVVTVKSLNGVSIEEYAVTLFEKWGIGKKGKDNGVLFLVATDERKMRIEVGYGLEGALPDGLAGEIRDTYILPYFKNGNFVQGIFEGTYAIAAVIGKEYNVDLLSFIGKDANRYTENLARKNSPAREVLNVLFFLLFIFIMRGRFFLPFLLGSSLGGRGYWSSRSSFGGGGFGSGFGGFGGGSSGGGGASGGW
jgi:uncharacterized protein